MAWLDFLSPFLRGLLLATGVGLIVGLEREFNTKSEKGHMAGLRTFPLLAILGFVIAYLSIHHAVWLLPVSLAGIFALAAVAYFVQSGAGKYGLTTELSLLVIYAFGALIAYGYELEALAATVLVTALLSLKEELHWLVAQITEKELMAFVKFAVLTLLLLPMLPDRAFGPGDLINYQNLGWIVVIVSSIGFAGYLALKFAGAHRGILFSAVLGGLYSSTMIAWVFAARSRETPDLARPLGAGILLSSSVMYLRVLFFCFLFNPGLAWRMALPCGLLFVLTLGMVWYFLRAGGKGGKMEAIPLGNPLDIAGALFFAALYIAVSFMIYYARDWMGDSGSYLSALVAGVADIDAITISTAKWARAEFLSTAADMVLLAMISNTTFKFAATLLRGHRDLRPFLFWGFGGVLACAISYLLISVT
jgi:uncharacterized membrane protein (DUF4010 family)